MGSVVQVSEEETQSFPKVPTTFNNCKKISKSKLGSTPLVPISNPTIDVGGLKGTEKRHQSRDNLLTTF